MLDLKSIDKSWTLFLDRDGVINFERLGKYVLNWEEFEFLDGVLQALKIFEKKFGHIVVISNQRGVGKGLMTEDDLLHIHKEMQKKIEEAGGRIDKIYYCTDVDESCFYRKPNPGMGLQAMEDFPGIDAAKTIMVGNKPGDMQFGRAIGCYTVFVTTTNRDQAFPHPDIDLVFPTLIDFANALES